MYEEWIKYEKITADKPEVYQMAEILRIDTHGVVGRLLIVWSWFDDYTEDGTASDTMIRALDAKTRKGFCHAMSAVGWMRIEGGTISVCNYDKHNGASAKKRAGDRKRKQKSRGASSFCHSNVVTFRGQVSQLARDIRRTFVTVARSSQFFFFFFLYQGEEFIKYSVLEGQNGTEVPHGA